MKIYTFDDNNKKFNNTIFNSGFCSCSNNTNYSTLLDDIILSNIKKTNSYLTDINTNKQSIFIDKIILESKKDKALKSDFITALIYLANFGKLSKLPFKLGHAYYFGGSTPIIFHLDSIEIGNTEYYYDDILNGKFNQSTKKTIIDIYLNGNKNAEININL